MLNKFVWTIFAFEVTLLLSTLCSTDVDYTVSKNESQESPPTFVNPKKMQKMFVKPAGNMISFKCKVNGNPTPQITWYKDDQPPSRTLGNLKYGQGHRTLTLEDLVTQDVGNYTCKACNKLGCINYTYVLDVVERLNSKPVLIDALENTTAVVGSDAELKCKFLSDLNEYMQWFKMLDDNTTRILQKTGDTPQPDVLILNNVSYEDEGWYACVAANSLGSTASTGYLRVVASREL